MKIGILTFHSVDNYGAVLQAYALQAFLVSQGYHVEIIDYRPSYFHSPRHWPVRPDRLLGEIYCRIMARRFEQFRTRYLNRTPICLTATDLEKNLPQYDAMIVGSDQVWSPDVDRRKETDPVYFLGWAKGSRRISYAASFGTDTIPGQERESVARGLLQIENVSVRESSGVDLVKKLSGKEAQWVCDPVFLRSRELWMNDLGCSTKRGKDIVVYMPPQIPDAHKLFSELSRRQNKRVVHIGFNWHYAVTRGCTWRIPSPLGFIGRIALASGVVTRSFHGTAFSILMQTPFVYLLPAGDAHDRSTRVVSLLSRMGLGGRVLPETASAEEIGKVLESPIDWRTVDAARDGFVLTSRAWLREAMRGLKERGLSFCDDGISVAEERAV